MVFQSRERCLSKSRVLLRILSLLQQAALAFGRRLSIHRSTAAAVDLRTHVALSTSSVHNMHLGWQHHTSVDGISHRLCTKSACALTAQATSYIAHSKVVTIYFDSIHPNLMFKHKTNYELDFLLCKKVETISGPYGLGILPSALWPAQNARR